MELIISDVFTLHTWRMKKICHYFSLEVATVSTKLHQAPLAAVQNDARQTRNTEKEEECFFPRSKNGIYRSNHPRQLQDRGIQAITNLPLGSHSPEER